VLVAERTEGQHSLCTIGSGGCGAGDSSSLASANNLIGRDKGRCRHGKRVVPLETKNGAVREGFRRNSQKGSAHKARENLVCIEPVLWELGSKAASKDTVPLVHRGGRRNVFHRTPASEHTHPEVQSGGDLRGPDVARRGSMVQGSTGARSLRTEAAAIDVVQATTPPERGGTLGGSRPI
jgi:hypothetical protein